jgi:hypothetical protein
MTNAIRARSKRSLLNIPEMVKMNGCGESILPVRKYHEQWMPKSTCHSSQFPLLHRITRELHVRQARAPKGVVVRANLQFGPEIDGS